MKVLSPAKVNLYLKVLCRRNDGFHELETLFERISLFDEIHLSSRAKNITLDCGRADIPCDERNLAFRAAALLRERLNVRKGVHIRLKKNIPVAAGLGGGSSNAAAVLMGLNRLWRLRLSRKRLLALAAELGSDVPFFIMDTPFALAAGRGELLRAFKPAKNHAKLWHCLVKPSFGISTKEAYQALRAPLCPNRPKSSDALTLQKANAKMLLHSIHEGRSKDLSKLLTNSLEVIQNNRVAKILKIKKQLVHAGALGSLMSGSGSTVFGIFRTERDARRAASFFKNKKGRRVFIASTF